MTHSFPGSPRPPWEKLGGAPEASVFRELQQYRWWLEVMKSCPPGVIPQLHWPGQLLEGLTAGFWKAFPDSPCQGSANHLSFDSAHDLFFSLYSPHYY